MNFKHRQAFRENYLHPSLESGLIEMTIPDKPGSRLQKYRLTEKGIKATGTKVVHQLPTQSLTQSPTQSEIDIHKMIELLKDESLSSGELRKKMNFKHRHAFRENYLHPALESGLIEMTIPEKPGSRLQKYRLTEQGKKAIK
jgi:DNA-binding PadR family transcriptional regulator